MYIGLFPSHVGVSVNVKEDNVCLSSQREDLPCRLAITEIYYSVCIEYTR